MKCFENFKTGLHINFKQVKHKTVSYVKERYVTFNKNQNKIILGSAINNCKQNSKRILSQHFRKRNSSRNLKKEEKRSEKGFLNPSCLEPDLKG